MRTFAGREAHPVALALTLAASSIALGWLLRPFRDGWQTAAAGYALCIAIVLTAAWIVDRREWTRAAMLASVGLWSYTAAVALWVIGSPTSALLAIAWGVLAFFSYDAEVRGASQRVPQV